MASKLPLYWGVGACVRLPDTMGRLKKGAFVSNLVLSRFKGESIMIGDDIEVAIVKVSRDGEVRLCISAPRSISVHRKEVYQRLKERSQGNDCKERPGKGNYPP